MIQPQRHGCLNPTRDGRVFPHFPAHLRFTLGVIVGCRGMSWRRGKCGAAEARKVTALWGQFDRQRATLARLAGGVGLLGWRWVAARALGLFDLSRHRPLFGGS